MRVITINVPEYIIAGLQKMQDEGIVPSRSEAIRHCIVYALPKLLGLEEELSLYSKGLSDLKPSLERIQHSNEELRKLYPNINDYKFMNEEAIKE